MQFGVSSFTLNSGKTLTALDLVVVSSGAASLAGTLTVVGGEVLISATDIIQTGGGITAGSLGTITSSQDGSNRAVALTAGSNAVGIFAADSTAAGGTVALTTTAGTSVGSTGGGGGSGGIAFITGPFGVQTNNGNITIKANGTLTVSGSIGAGTGTVTLVTLPLSSGDIDIHSAVSGATVVLAADGDVNITAAVTAQNSGAGAFKSTGDNFDLNGGSITADSATIVQGGGVTIGGSITATTLAIEGSEIEQTAGTVTVTTLGAVTTDADVLLTNVTFNAGGTVAGISADGQDFQLTATNDVKIGAIGASSAISNTGATVPFAAVTGVTALGFGSVTITASTGNVTGAAGDGITGNFINVTATTGGIGTAGTGLIINPANTATLTTGGANAAGNIHITTTGTSLDGLMFNTDPGTVQTITIDKATGLTVNGDVDAGTDNLKGDSRGDFGGGEPGVWAGGDADFAEHYAVGGDWGRVAGGFGGEHRDGSDIERDDGADAAAGCFDHGCGGEWLGVDELHAGIGWRERDGGDGGERGGDESDADGAGERDGEH